MSTQVEQEQVVKDSLDLLHQAFEQQRQVRDGSVVLKGYATFLDEVGGAERAMGKLLARGHAEAMAGKGRLRLGWAKLLTDMAKVYDEMNAATLDLAGVEEEDLRAYVTELAVKLLATNGEFRRSCILELIRREPNFLESFIDNQDTIEVQAIEEEANCA